MTSFNGNNAYIKIDSVVVNAYFKKFEITPSIEAVDVTAGSGTNHRQRATGLEDTAATMTLVYDNTALASYIQTLKPGLHTIEYGPESNVTGKPKHIQKFILTEAPHGIEIEKSEVLFQLSFTAAEAPTFNIHDGAVW
jgi:hypothetical protein